MSSEISKAIRLLRKPAGRVRAYLRRLNNWRKIAVGLKGYKLEDRRILTRAVIGSPFSALKNLKEWKFPVVSSDCTVISRGVGRFRVRAGSDDLYHAVPRQEPAVERVVRRKLEAGDTFVDAGSNIGFYTVLASRLVGSNGCVIACEMIPETARILREHVLINGCKNVVVEEAALTSVSGQFVQASVDDGRSGTASIARHSGGETIQVPTKTLYDILRKTRRVKLMKMDLEGAELGALEGLGALIEKTDAIVFENRNDLETVDFLSSHGFHIRRIDGSNAIAERGNSNI